MSDPKACPGCETMPTAGFDSKPANADGFIHWCAESRRIALEQEETTEPTP